MKCALALDPSGAFNEGKGTTGWCIIDTISKNILAVGNLYAREYPTAEDYWRAHCDLIADARSKYGIESVITEAYILYARTATSQINSSFETSQLIGIIKFWCHASDIACVIQRAVDVKNRWKNEILEHKQIITRQGRYWTIHGDPINNHTLDAIRHAMHYAYFGGNHAGTSASAPITKVHGRSRRYQRPHA